MNTVSVPSHWRSYGSTLIGGCGKAGQIADDAATEGHDGGAPVAPAGQHRVIDQVQRFPVLVGLAIGKDDGRYSDPDLLQASTQLVHVERRNRRVADQCHA